MIRIIESDDYDPIITNQRYTSAATSINSKKLPAIFGMIEFDEGDINLDIGGGRFDNVAKELEKIGVTNLVYDPYNRSSSHNSSVLGKVKENGGADSVTCSNVLNVIAEPEARMGVIQNCYRFLKSGRPAYFTVYEGDGSGEGKETKAGYQLNRKTKDYVSEIEQVFSNVSRRGKLITAIK